MFTENRKIIINKTFFIAVSNKPYFLKNIVKINTIKLQLSKIKYICYQELLLQ